MRHRQCSCLAPEKKFTHTLTSTVLHFCTKECGDSWIIAYCLGPLVDSTHASELMHVKSGKLAAQDTIQEKLNRARSRVLAKTLLEFTLENSSLLRKEDGCLPPK
jgi:hypothetical protein